jgi:serine/threonine protein kinase/regulation of enolase protein 1 (concanavalin A-like superfamily)
MAAVTSCPDSRVLERLALGQMSPLEVEQLAVHCEKCEKCIQAIQQIRGADTLVSAMSAQGTIVEPAHNPAIAALVARLKALRRQDAAAIEEATVPPSSVNTPLSEPPDTLPHESSTNLDFLAPAQQKDEIGRLGNFRVLKVLGQGGMGVVLQAEDTGLHRLCALKVMLSEVARRPEMKERFLREARAAAQIEHDHIVPIYQVAEDRGVPFIAMPFLKGSTLEDWMQTKQRTRAPITVANILKLGREMAKGLSAAHELGLVHRDIKPANIWLDSTVGGRVKILDFGLARLTSSGEANPDRKVGGGDLTQSGMIMGTPAYMAPEQAQGKKDLIDGRTDLFSLGCILYRLCTGQQPFKGDDMISTLVAVAMENPTPPSEVNPEIPQPLSDLVMKLLEKKPEDRPESAKEVVKIVQQMEKDLAAGTLKPASETAPAIRPKPAVAKPEPVSELPSVTAEMPQPTSNRKRKRSKSKKRRDNPILLIGGGVFGIAALVVAGIILFWETPKGTVRVEINDPNTQAAIDKDEFNIKGADKHDISLKPGEHGLRVKRGDLEFETDKFILKKGDTVTLKVELLPGKVQVVQDGKVIGIQNLRANQVAAGTSIPGWGEVIDPDRDCKVSASGNRLTIEVPGNLHALPSPGQAAAEWLTQNNSPRVLQDVEGDFVAQVKVAGTIYADVGNKIPGKSTVQAGALLVWADEKNFAVIERLSLVAATKTTSYSRLGAYRDCTFLFTDLVKAGNRNYFLPVADVSSSFRIERRQGKWDAAYSQDGGQSWKPLGPQAFGLDLPSKVKVGVCAINSTTSPLKVEFEDLRITRLSDGKTVDSKDFVSLFNGKDLTGWSVAPIETNNYQGWTVEEGALVARGDDFKTRNFLFSDREYADFVLRLEFNFDKGGFLSSGVGLRAKPAEKLPAYGRLIQDYPVLKLGGAPAAANEETGTTNWVLDGFNVKPDRSIDLLPPGSWNKLEIEVKGRTIRTTVNGKPSLTAALAPGGLLSDGSIPALGRPKGRIGLQKHTGTVRFRNIELKELSTANADSAPSSGIGGLQFAATEDRVEIDSLKPDCSKPYTFEAYVLPKTSGIFLQWPGVTSLCAGQPKTTERPWDLEGWTFSLRDVGKVKNPFAESPNRVEFGKLHHVAGVFSNGELRLFVNGKKVSVTKGPEKPGGISGAPFLIGGKVYPFSGIITEVRISQVARYDQDFTPAQRFETDKDTLGRYYFDEGAGNVLKDSSGKGHDGKIVGAKWVRLDQSAAAPLRVESPPPVRNWGKFTDPDGDCKLTSNDNNVAIDVPGKYHDLQAGGAVNSPRVFQEVTGDFVAQVKIANVIHSEVGSMLPGLAGGAFRSGGLLIWKDDQSFIRFERVSRDVDGKVVSLCWLEPYLNGDNAVDPATKEELWANQEVPDKITNLRVERKQDVFHLSYSQDDGKTWVPFGKASFKLKLPAKLKVGLSVVNNTTQPLRVEFEDFQVTRSGAPVTAKEDEPAAKPQWPLPPPPDLSKAKPLFEDKFANAQSGWFVAVKGKSEYGYDKGHYFLVSPTGRWSDALCPHEQFGDFACRVVGRVATAHGTWALLIRNPQLKHELRISIAKSGSLRVNKMNEDGSNERLVGPIQNPAIKDGGEWNSMLVIARRNRYEIYVNDIMVCEPFEFDFVQTPAKLGLVVNCPQNSELTRAEFQQITVWSAQGLSTFAQRRDKMSPPK